MPPVVNRRWSLLLVWVVVWAGCSSTSPHPYSIAEGHRGAPSVRKAAVLRFNLVEPIPRELRKPR